MLNEVVHDVLYTLHRKQSIPRAASISDFERTCRRICRFLQWAMLGCLLAIGGCALYVLVVGSVSDLMATAAQLVILALVATALLWIVVDALPTCRDFGRFDTYMYQVRQLEAAHDLAHAGDLERFGLPALNLTDRWLALRVERMKLRMGILMGGSDKVAVLAVICGAWTIWHNFPGAASALEQYLYLLFGGVLGGWGVGGTFANASIARLSFLCQTSWHGFFHVYVFPPGGRRPRVASTRHRKRI